METGSGPPRRRPCAALAVLIGALLLAGCGDLARSPEPDASAPGGAGAAAGVAPSTPPHDSPAVTDPWLAVDPDELEPNETVYWEASRGPEIRRQARMDRPPGIDADSDHVVVRVVVTRSGRVAKAQILLGPPLHRIEDELARTLRAWRFEPAVHRGQPVAVYMNLVVRYRDSEPPAQERPKAPTPTTI